MKNIDFTGVLTVHRLLCSYKEKGQLDFYVYYVALSPLQNEKKKIEKKRSAWDETWLT
jgi:hypothetical protein